MMWTHLIIFTASLFHWAFSAVLCSPFKVKMPSSSDKITTAAASTLISSAEAFIDKLSCLISLHHREAHGRLCVLYLGELPAGASCFLSADGTLIGYSIPRLKMGLELGKVRELSDLKSQQCSCISDA